MMIGSFLDIDIKNAVPVMSGIIIFLIFLFAGIYYFTSSEYEINRSFEHLVHSQTETVSPGRNREE